jgi:hypothetical protein
MRLYTTLSSLRNPRIDISRSRVPEHPRRHRLAFIVAAASVAAARPVVAGTVVPLIDRGRDGFAGIWCWLRYLILALTDFALYLF